MIYPEHIQSLHHTQNMPTKYIIVIILMVKIHNLKSFFLLSVLIKLWHMILIMTKYLVFLMQTPVSDQNCKFKFKWKINL